MADDLNPQKEYVLKKLKDRDEERKLNVEKRHVAKAEKLHDLQQGKLYAAKFMARKNELLDKLVNLEKDKEQGGIMIEKSFAAIIEESRALQSWFNDQSIHITSFDCEKSRMEIKDLEQTLQDYREKLLPKKKFAFKTRKKPILNIAKEPVVDPSETDDQVDPMQSIDPRLTIANKSNCNLTMSDVSVGQTLLLHNINNGTIKINEVCGNLYVKKLINCNVITKPVAGSIWIDKCENCTFTLLCRQLRIHETKQSKFILWVCSRPIIETCSDLSVAPLVFDTQSCDENIQESFELAGFPSNGINLWNEVEDFDFPDSRVMGGSKNWHILDKAQSSDS